jgi:hypothetical protein
MGKGGLKSDFCIDLSRICRRQVPVRLHPLPWLPAPVHLWPLISIPWLVGWLTWVFNLFFLFALLCWSYLEMRVSQRWLDSFSSRSSVKRSGDSSIRVSHKIFICDGLHVRKNIRQDKTDDMNLVGLVELEIFLRRRKKFPSQPIPHRGILMLYTPNYSLW